MSQLRVPQRSGLLIAGLLVVAVAPAPAQWRSQSINLQPGWNAIYLDVDPPESDADGLLAGLPVESVWMWNQRFNAINFLADPEELLPSNPDWLVYFPPSSPQAGVKTLFGLKGGEQYLVKLGGISPATLTVTGRPVPQRTRWITNSYNLAGFEIDSAAPPTYGQYFAPAPQHRGSQSAFRMEPSGRWTPINDSYVMRRGEALWIYSKGASSYNGPLDLTGIAATFMDYNRNTEEFTFELRNRTGQARTYTLELEPSAAPPIAGEAAVHAPTKLGFFQFDQGPESFGGYIPVQPSVTITVPANGVREVRFAIDRVAMGPIPDGTFATFQSLLAVKDGAGARRTVPVRAFALNQTLALLDSATVNTKLAQKSDPGINASPWEGLWVGRVRLDAVNFPANLPERNRPVPAGGEFDFRIIVHIDETGTARLVQQVTLMSKTVAPEKREIVLVTNDERLADFDGVVDRGGQLVGQRISSVNFPYFNIQGEPRHTISSTGGEFEDGDSATTNTLTFRVPLDYDDPLNPFMHRFHPDHDNLDPNFQPFPESEVDIDGDGVDDLRYAATTRRESLSILRDITMEFAGVEPGRAAADLNPGWLANRIGGYYREEIYGLYRTNYGAQPAPIRTPLITTGTFSLVRVSSVAKLNDGVN